MDAWTRLRSAVTAQFAWFPRIGMAIAPGILTAAAVLLLWQSVGGWIAICGTTSAASATFCFALAIAVAIAASLTQRYAPSRSETGMAITGVFLASWICPALIDEVFLRTISFGAPAALIWIAAGVPIVIMATSAALLLCRYAQSTPGRFSLSVSLATILFMLHVQMPQSYSITISIVAVLGVLCNIRGTTHSAEPPVVTPGDPRLFVSSVAVGLTLAAAWMIFDRVFSLTLMTAASGFACTTMLLGIASFGPLRFRQHPRLVLAVALLALVGSSFYYDELLHWNLTLNATTNSGWKVIFAQGMQLAGWSVPLLMILLAVSGILRPSEQPGFSVSGLVCGIGLTLFCAFLPVHPAMVVVAGLTVLVAPALLQQTESQPGSFAAVFGRIGLRLSALAAVICLAVNPPDLTRPARLLFTGHAQEAVHRGIDHDMIPMTEASRLMRSTQTIGHTTTAWKFWGDAVDCRVNGQSVGVESTNTSTTPQSPAELLTAVIPLSVHPQPGSVLVLDDVRGITRTACEEFPLHTIRAVDALPATDVATQSPLDTVRFIAGPTEIAVRDPETSTFDVVIAALVDPVQAHVSSRTTASFYQATAQRLKTDGIFCQRIRQAQLEAGSLLKILGTLSSVFEHTAVIQMVPGELAVLSSNSSAPLIDDSLLDRLQRSHVRHLLARCGWDWCQLAALPVIDSADPIGLWQHAVMPEPANARNGHFGLRLGWETLRPVNRAYGLAQLLGPHEIRIADAVGSGEAYAEFGRRFSAYAQQMEVLTAFPDEPWTYRRSLKAEMLRNTRPPVHVRRQGQTEKQIHPLDQLRKDYVATLATLLRQAAAGELQPEALRRLPDTAGPYEPLISDMAHYEVVRIHELAGHPSPEDEFRHRLHTVYFTPARDLSVRSVVGALEQLINNPELVPNDAERFDRLNGLVQQLIHRWGRRTTFEPRSARRTQRDVDLSLSTTRRALDAMEDLRESVAMESADFVQRRRFVNEALIIPLRDYRDSVLAHRARNEPILASDASEPDDRDLSLDPSQWTTN